MISWNIFTGLGQILMNQEQMLAQLDRLSKRQEGLMAQADEILKGLSDLQAALETESESVASLQNEVLLAVDSIKQASPPGNNAALDQVAARLESAASTLQAHGAALDSATASLMAVVPAAPPAEPPPDAGPTPMPETMGAVNVSGLTGQK